MGFSADAIGFLLELDDQLSPGLVKAGKNYAKFTRQIDRLNQKAVTGVNKTFAAMAKMAESLEKLPKNVAQAMQKMPRGMGSGKAMKLNVNVTLKGGRLDKEIANAVVGGLRGASRRMPRGTAGGTALAALHAPMYGPALPPGHAVREYQRMQNARGRVSNYHDTRAQANQSWKSATAAATASKNPAMARQGLLAVWAAMPANERKKRQAEFTKLMTTLRQSAGATSQMAGSTTMMGRTLGFLQRGFAGIGNTVGGIAASARDVSRNTRFTSLITALDRFAGLFTSGHQFFQGMNDLNKELHLSRAELAEMGKAGISIANQHGGLLDPNNVKDAMMSLAKFGTRAREEFEKLTPTVALAMQAMNMSGDTAGQLARGLGQKFKMSGSDVADVFANISRIGGATGVSGEELGASMIDNSSRAGAFLKGLSPSGRKSALTNMASLQGVLTKNFGDSGNHIGGMIAEALSDAGSDAARNVMNLTGMTGGSHGSLGAAIQSGDLSSITNAIAARAKSTGGNATVASQMAANMGLRSGGELLQFADSAGDMSKDFNALAASTIAAGEGFKRLAEDAGKSLSEFDKLKNQFKTTLAETIPAPLLQLLSEVSSSGTGLAAGGFLTGLAGRGLGKIPILGSLLRSLPVVGGAFGTAAAATGTTAAATAGGTGVAGFLGRFLGTAGRAGGAATVIPALMAAGVSHSVNADADADLGAGSLANIAQVMSGKRPLRQGFIARGANILGNLDRSAPDDQQAYRIQELIGGLKSTLPADLPNRAQRIGEVEMAAWSNPDAVPGMLRNLYPAIASAQMKEAEAAKAAAAAEDLRRYQYLGMGAYMSPMMTVTPPANSNAPPRPLPPDKVTEAMATGKY